MLKTIIPDLGEDRSVDSEPEIKIEYRGEFYGESPYFIGIGRWTPQISVAEEEQIEQCLSGIEAAAVVSLLEDAIDELTILRYVIGAPLVTANPFYTSMKERFTRRLTPERIFPEVDSKPVLDSAIRLQTEREQISIVLYKTTKTLMEDGCFPVLMSMVENLRKEEEDEKILIQELKNNLLHLKDLKVKVEEKRKLEDLEVKGREELMYQLQDELDDVKLKCEVEEKFVSKWEVVRNAQNLLRFRRIENQYKENISKVNVKIKMEKRVTHEMQLYLKTNQAELEEQLEEWMATYDAEMERRENLIIRMKYQRDQAEEKKHQLRDLYEERKEEIKEWIAFRELRKKRTAASLQIQSWWRGIMVRKRLGPYKPKKEKKEKKGKGKGEKKKKKK